MSIENIQLYKREWNQQIGDHWVNGKTLPTNEYLCYATPSRYSSARTSDFKFKIEPTESVFIFSASPGTGKTHLAYALFNEYILRQIEPQFKYKGSWEEGCSYFKPNVKSKFTTGGALQLRFRESMRPDSEESEGDIVKQLSNSDIFILDDFGGMRDNTASDYSLGCVFEILNNRYNHEQGVIITSNKSLKQLEQTFDSRITSRIAEMCRVIELKGEDRRLNKAVKNV